MDKRLIEALVAIAGILLFGFVSIPIVGWITGAHISATQGAQMSVIFFGLRVVWLYALRVWFSRRT